MKQKTEKDALFKKDSAAKVGKPLKKKKSFLKRKKYRYLALLFLVFTYLARGIWFLLKYAGIGIFYISKGIYRGMRRIFKGKLFNKRDKEGKSSERESAADLPQGPASEIKVIEAIKGNYDTFWNNLEKSDSLIGLVIGARGSGKTAVALSMVENLKDSKKKVFAMGISSLPRWIKSVDKIEDIENDSLVVIDEGGILFSSRNSMSNANKFLSELLLIARHKNLTILFISQNSSNLEINTLRQADFMVLKKSSLLQKNFERKIVAKIYEEHSKGFEKHKKIKGLTLIYSDDFVGFVENDLPSFWSSKVSKSFR